MTDLRALLRRRIEFEPEQGAAAAVLAAAMPWAWPAGLAPQPRPYADAPLVDAALPPADVLVVTWTAAEHDALADTLTPGHPRREWYPYTRHFQTYLPEIREGAPSRGAGRLGSWFPIDLAGRRVICFKSELHLNQDGVDPQDSGNATLPVARLFRQLIGETGARLVITVGTAGATYPNHDIGDVVVTRSARFRCAQEFRNAPFNNVTYTCPFEVPTAAMEQAGAILSTVLDRLQEPDFGPPTTAYPNAEPVPRRGRAAPRILLDGRDFPEFHPILTTDFFEFGNSVNHLEEQGAGVEMGDAVLGLVAAELGDAAPRWLVIRNMSDPQINGRLPTSPRARNMQAHWAVWYYETYGYWTSVCSAVATWAVIAGGAA